MPSGNMTGTVYSYSARSTGIQLGSNEYPNGTVTLEPIADAYWYLNAGVNSTRYFDCYICDANGNNKNYFGRLSIKENNNSRDTISGSVNAVDLKGASLYFKTVGGYHNNYLQMRGTFRLTVTTAQYSFSITVSAGTGGSCSVSPSGSATPGTVVTLSPSASTGYQFTGYTKSPSSLSISGNKFTMPAQAVSITANFSKINYTISKAASPSGGGTVTVQATAQMGNSVSISQTPNTGYQFDGWSTSPALSISGGRFTMPASNVSITAKYIRRSTGTIPSKDITGGTTVTLTLSSESTAYTHKYRLTFGTGMDTGLIDLAAGVKTAQIAIPLSWCAKVTDATSKAGGTLTIYTYRNGSQVASAYEITGLTFLVPAEVMPAIDTIAISRVLTIDNVTYPALDDFYVQNHCGVRTQAEASGNQGSTIDSMRVAISGYAGGNYSKDVTTDEIDFTSGILSIAGETTITVTATDSRGRTVTETRTITVQAYVKPSGSIEVWRVDAQGDVDDMGEYGRYRISKQYTQLGSNALTWTITARQSSATDPADTGDLLPGNRLMFDQISEYTVTLELSDLLETVIITTSLPSARFIMYVDSGGNKIGFMKVPNQSIPAGMKGTFEIDGDTQIYIGQTTLEDYIRSIVTGMNS